MIRFQLKDSDRSFHAKILDISETGLKIHYEDRKIFESSNEGDLLQFETHEEFFKIKGVGKVIWVSKDMMGVDFEEIDSDSEIMLNEFLGICV